MLCLIAPYPVSYTHLDVYKRQRFLQMTSDYGKPWYGQLMAGPQMMAYLIQINFWLSHYRITLKL